MPRWLRWLCCSAGLLLVHGCEGDSLSVGAFRCEGEGVTCTPITASGIDVNNHDVPEATDAPATVTWRIDLACPDPKVTCSADSTAVVVHADDSATVARVFDTNIGPSHMQGVWIGHFDDQGSQAWSDDGFFEHPDPDGPGLHFDAALALDRDDRAWLAVERDMSDHHVLSVYRLGEGKHERVFTAEGTRRLTGLAIDGDDVLIAGFYFEGSGKEHAIPELARYRKDGALLWRQSGLLSSLDRPSGAEIGVADASLTVDEHGRALVTVPIPAQPGNSEVRVIRVRRDGNMDSAARVIASDAYRSRASFALNADPIVGADAYFITRVNWRANASAMSGDAVFRVRKEFWETSMFGLDRDDQDRVLIATRRGVLDEPQFLIDRVASDFTRRETFVVEGAADLVAAHDMLDGPLEGIRSGANEDVYFWSDAQLGRIVLEAQSDTKPPTSQHRSH